MNPRSWFTNSSIDRATSRWTRRRRRPSVRLRCGLRSAFGAPAPSELSPCSLTRSHGPTVRPGSRPRRPARPTGRHGPAPATRGGPGCPHGRKRTPRAARRAALRAAGRLHVDRRPPGGAPIGRSPVRRPPSTAPPVPPRLPRPGGDPDARVTAALSRLDRRAQVGQLFVVGRAARPTSPAARPWSQSGVGGVFLAGRSTRSVADLASVTAGWQALTSGRACGWPPTRRAAWCRP